MQIKRFKDIVAVKHDTSVAQKSHIVAFHATNLEVAEISEEAFNAMAPISISNGAIPDSYPSTSLEVSEAMHDWNSSVNQDAKPGKIDFGIRSITINVNQICNLKCAYCAAGGDGTYGEPLTQISIEKTLPQIKFFIDRLPHNAKFSITFVGGEPLLHPFAVKAIYDYAVELCKKKNVRFSISIVTNGTLITPEVAKLLKQMQIHITISLDGVKEINDVVRPSKNKSSSTEATLNGLNNFNSDRGSIISFGIAAVFSDQNRDILTNYRFFRTLNPDWIEFNFPYSEKSKSLNEEYISKMRELAALAWELGGEREVRKLRAFDHYFKLLDSQQLIENHCGAGKSYLMVDSKNRLYTCPWEVGKSSEVVGVEQTLDNEKLSKYSKSLIELNNCQSCWARHLCGGGCMYIHKEHTGEKHKKDLLFCERTRSLILTSILYYKLARPAVD
ncbi:MAG: radical protein [Pseudobdellovibrio sp.]|jgi:uncharacterized protein|nr:radical protein [Pseudobdellovibrio sp.]